MDLLRTSTGLGIFIETFHLSSTMVYLMCFSKIFPEDKFSFFVKVNVQTDTRFLISSFSALFLNFEQFAYDFVFFWKFLF